MVESSSDSSLPLCARCFQRSPADTVPKTKCYSGTILLCLCSSQRGGRHTRRSLSAPLGLGGVMGPVLICYPLTMTKWRLLESLKSPAPLSTTIPCHTRVQVRGGIATAWMSAQEPSSHPWIPEQVWILPPIAPYHSLQKVPLQRCKNEAEGRDTGYPSYWFTWGPGVSVYTASRLNSVKPEFQLP